MDVIETLEAIEREFADPENFCVGTFKQGKARCTIGYLVHLTLTGRIEYQTELDAWGHLSEAARELSGNGSVFHQNDLGLEAARAMISRAKELAR